MFSLMRSNCASAERIAARLEADVWDGLTALAFPAECHHGPQTNSSQE